MKNHILLYFLVVSLFACNPTTTSKVVSDQKTTPPTTVTPKGPAPDVSDPMPTISGQWTVSSVSAFAQPGTLPKYEEGDMIWDFKKTMDNYGEVQVMVNNEVKNDRYTLSEGKHQFWVDDCIVKINRTLYRYNFTTSNATFLYLDNNLDISLPDGGYTLILKKM